MPDLEPLRDLATQVRPPSIDSLASTARRRTRRATAAAGLAVTTTVILVIGGVALAGRGDDLAAPGPADTPNPPTQSAVFDPDEPTLPGGVRVLSQTIDGSVPVRAGRYAVRVSDSLLYQVDVPDDTEVVSGTYLNPVSPGEHDLNGLLWIDPAGDDTALPVDPCHDHSAKPVGPTVADLATALSDQPFLTVAPPVEVTVGGMDGLMVKATVPTGADVSACQGGSVDLISDSHSVGAGTVERLWILDVDGARHVIQARVSTGADEDATSARQHNRAIARMVESITFNHG